MKTDVIAVTGENTSMEAVLTQIGKMCEYKELPAKQAMPLRLLAEEMMAMMRAVTGYESGKFWAEDQDQVYELHLAVTTLVDEEARRQLLSASTSGKNEAARGFMGKIRSFFEPVNSDPLFISGYAGTVPQMSGIFSWSMVEYRDRLSRHREENQEAWDELEKSVVARVADDVKVRIQDRTVEMIMFKKIG